MEVLIIFEDGDCCIHSGISKITHTDKTIEITEKDSIIIVQKQDINHLKITTK